MAHKSAVRKSSHRRVGALAKATTYLAAPIPDVELLLGTMANPNSGIRFILGIKKKAGKRISETQSVIFDKLKWTADAAKQWLRDHNFTGSGKDEGATFWRFRQQDPKRYKEFRTVVPGTRPNPRYEHPYPTRDWKSEAPTIKVTNGVETAKLQVYADGWHAISMPDQEPFRKSGPVWLDATGAKWTPVVGGRRHTVGNPTPASAIHAYDEHLATTLDPAFRSATPDEQAAAMTVQDATENPTKGAVKVIFRKWPKSEGGEVIALFPEHPGSNEYEVASFMHIGQHGDASQDIMSHTKAATPAEYADLKRELEQGYGYKLKVAHKITAADLKQRRKIIRGNSGRRGNPEPAAAALYEDFHGRPPGETKEIITEVHDHGWLTQLGVLVELKVATVNQLDATLTFEKDPPDLCSSEDGRQLYIEGGDQSLDLKALKMSGDKWEKDSMVIGVLYELTYQTEKGFHRFKTIDYYHKLAEEGGPTQPMLLYDPLNKLLSISGGNYKTEDRGIIN